MGSNKNKNNKKNKKKAKSPSQPSAEADQHAAEAGAAAAPQSPFDKLLDDFCRQSTELDLLHYEVTEKILKNDLDAVRRLSVKFARQAMVFLDSISNEVHPRLAKMAQATHLTEGEILLQELLELFELFDHVLGMLTAFQGDEPHERSSKIDQYIEVSSVFHEQIKEIMKVREREASAPKLDKSSSSVTEASAAPDVEEAEEAAQKKRVDEFLQHYRENEQRLWSPLHEGNVQMWLVYILNFIYQYESDIENQVAMLAAMFEDILLNIYQHIKPESLSTFTGECYGMIKGYLEEFDNYLRKKYCIKQPCPKRIDDQRNQLRLLANEVSGLSFDKASQAICLPLGLKRAISMKETGKPLPVIFFAGCEYQPECTDPLSGIVIPKDYLSKNYYAQINFLPISLALQIVRLKRLFNQFLLCGGEQRMESVMTALKDVFEKYDKAHVSISNRLARIRTTMLFIRYTLAETFLYSEKSFFLSLKTSCAEQLDRLQKEMAELQQSGTSSPIIQSVMEDYDRQLRLMKDRLDDAGKFIGEQYTNYIVVDNEPTDMIAQCLARGPIFTKDNKWVHFGPNVSVERLYVKDIIYGEYAAVYGYTVDPSLEVESLQVEFSVRYLRAIQRQLVDSDASLLPAVPVLNAKRAIPLDSAKAVMAGLKDLSDDDFTVIHCAVISNQPDEQRDQFEKRLIELEALLPSEKDERPVLSPVHEEKIDHLRKLIGSMPRTSLTEEGLAKAEKLKRIYETASFNLAVQRLAGNGIQPNYIDSVSKIYKRFDKPCPARPRKSTKKALWAADQLATLIDGEFIHAHPYLSAVLVEKIIALYQGQKAYERAERFCEKIRPVAGSFKGEHQDLLPWLLHSVKPLQYYINQAIAGAGARADAHEIACERAARRQRFDAPKQVLARDLHRFYEAKRQTTCEAREHVDAAKQVLARDLHRFYEAKRQTTCEAREHFDAAKQVLARVLHRLYEAKYQTTCEAREHFDAAKQVLARDLHRLYEAKYQTTCEAREHFDEAKQVLEDGLLKLYQAKHVAELELAQEVRAVVDDMLGRIELHEERARAEAKRAKLQVNFMQSQLERVEGESAARAKQIAELQQALADAHRELGQAAQANHALAQENAWLKQMLYGVGAVYRAGPSVPMSTATTRHFAGAAPMFPARQLPHGGAYPPPGHYPSTS